MKGVGEMKMKEAWAKRFGEKYMGKQVQEQVDGMDWKMASAILQEVREKPLTIEELANKYGWGLYETYRTVMTMAQMGLVEVYRDDDTWDYYRPGVTLSVKAILEVKKNDEARV